MGHNYSGRIVGYSYCCKCGLILLGNAATARAARAPCKK